MSGVTRIMERRGRQFAKGYTHEHDLHHEPAEFVQAAASMAQAAAARIAGVTPDFSAAFWPWEGSWKEPPEDKDALLDYLADAGALIAAAIDRIGAGVRT
jgi:hypothetical protein